MAVVESTVYAWWRKYIYFDETQAFETYAWTTPSWLL